MWTKRWAKNPQYAMLAGILYAFCGYNIYSIFYDSFIDVTALFPYLLAALDDAIIDKRRGYFSIWVAISLLVNYYFFIGEAVFLILYFACMMLSKKYALTAKLFLRMAGETILGVAMGAVLLVPAAISLSQNPRTSSFLNDYDFICYSEPQKYMAILASMFIMPDAPYQNTLFSQSRTQWQNVCAYLPVVGIIGGVALNRADRKHPFAMLLRWSVIFAFVPMLNAIFTLENSAYYARWFYMPILILCGATVVILENDTYYHAQWRDAWITVLIFTAGFASLGLVPSTVALFGFKLGVTTSALIFWLLWGISIAGVLLCAFVCKKFYGKTQFVSVMMSAVMVFSLVYSEAHILLTRYSADDQEKDHSWYEGYEDLDNIDAMLQDDSFYRIDGNNVINCNLPLGLSTETFFSSTVSSGIFSFYKNVGRGRIVQTLEGLDRYAFRSLLSTKYIIVDVGSEYSWNAEEKTAEITLNESNAQKVGEIFDDSSKFDPETYVPAEWAAMWTEYGRTNQNIIYENQNFIPMGFTFDYYITAEQLANADPAIRSNLLLKALVLTDEQVEKYGDLLQPLPESELDNCTYAAFEQNCAQRRQHTADTFEANNYGFTATTNFAADELVFFSVPYEKNAFTATVNGQPAEVEEVDCGLMAIRVPAGQADISVTYHTPGLRLSVSISLAAAAVWIIYMVYVYRDDKRKKSAHPVPPTETTA